MNSSAHFHPFAHSGPPSCLLIATRSFVAQRGCWPAGPTTSRSETSTTSSSPSTEPASPAEAMYSHGRVRRLLQAPRSRRACTPRCSRAARHGVCASTACCDVAEAGRAAPSCPVRRRARRTSPRARPRRAGARDPSGRTDPARARSRVAYARSARVVATMVGTPSGSRVIADGAAEAGPPHATIQLRLRAGQHHVEEDRRHDDEDDDRRTPTIFAIRGPLQAGACRRSAGLPVASHSRRRASIERDLRGSAGSWCRPRCP